MRFSSAALIAALGMALAAGCSSSPPTRFYTLSALAPQVVTPPGVGLVQVTGVSIPGELDRPELVRQEGPNQLAISGLNRWAAPLDQIIRRVLSDDIARRVPTPAAGQQYSVAVDIHEFYGDATCDVTLHAGWTVHPAHGAAGPPVNEEIQVPSSGICPDTLAANMSVAVAQLSDRIIAGVARMPAPGNP